MGIEPHRVSAQVPDPDIQRIIDRALQVRSVRHSADLHVCRAAGEIDLLTVTTLAGLLDHLYETGAPAVIVDLTEVTYCAAAGFRVMLAATARAQAAGRRLAVVIANPTVARVLTATDTADGIESYACLSDAMVALAASRSA